MLNVKYYLSTLTLQTEQSDQFDKQQTITFDSNNKDNDAHSITSICSALSSTEDAEELFSSLFTETREDILDVIELAYDIPPNVMKIICPVLGNTRCHRSRCANSIQRAAEETSHSIDGYQQSVIKVEEIEPLIPQSSINCICGATQNIGIGVVS
ncbi:unnamed protein product [Umbelopsis sp. WA50703]|jgi:hypothetical protein